MIRTKSVYYDIYYDKVEEEDGIRILVMRHWCRPLNKEKAAIAEWKREFPPSKELLDDWNNNRIDWATYEKRYLKEMAKQAESIKNLAQRAKTETITLLCKEPSDEHCHRRLLAEYIENIIK